MEVIEESFARVKEISLELEGHDRRSQALYSKYLPTPRLSFVALNVEESSPKSTLDSW